jgi:hypothetical protein
MLNFNVDPYYDDFDPNKNYHRVLYKPGRAVQARELTQSQTILQNQITNFADHFFTQNTPVKGGSITLDLNVKHLKLTPTFNNIDIVASEFQNQIVTDDTGTIVAKVIATEEATSSDPPTLILSYFSGGTFANSSNVIAATSSTIAQAAPTNHAGPAAVASISNGVFYIVNGYNFSSVQNQDGTTDRYSIGNFVSVQPQTIILSKYNNTPSARVGLDISEFVSDYVLDPSLLDPAVGSTNYQAPGADRYTIRLDLTTKALTQSTVQDQNFVELMRVENGGIIKKINETSYSKINDYVAKRSYETNGDYIVKQFSIIPKANTLDSNKYIINVGPGVAYVQGYRVENQSSFPLNARKARETKLVNNNVITPSYGNYIFVNDFNGSNNEIIDITKMQQVDLHCVGVANANTLTVNSYNSTVAANAYIRSITYSSSTTDANTQSYVYKAYLHSIANKTLSTTVSSATADTVTLTDTTGKFSAVNNAYVGVNVTIDSGAGSGQKRKVSAYNGTTKVLTLESNFSVIPTNGDTVSLRFEIKDVETVISVNSSTSTPITIYGTADVNAQGKVNNLESGDTLIFDSTEPELIFPLGSPYVQSISDVSFTSLQSYRGQVFSTAGGGGITKAVTIDASFQSTLNFIRTGASESIDSIKQNFIVMVTSPGSNANLYSGNIVHFTTTAGGARSVSVDATKTTATFTAVDLLPFTATIFTKVNVINGTNTNISKRTKTLNTANTTALGISGATATIGNTLIDLTKGQIYVNTTAAVSAYGTAQNLYVSDVKRIVKIIDPRGATPTLSMLSDASYDVTRNYTFDNGQRDAYYGHASITLKPGAPKPSRLWILFDYYETGGGDGFYSADSYVNEEFQEVPTYTAKNGTKYSLRDCVDFRPIVKNAQSSFVFRYSVEPSTSNFYGTLIPQDTTSFTNDYIYYLGRKDKLVLTKDSTFNIIEGISSENPLAPDTPSNAMLLADINLDPYTAYLPGETNGIPNLSLKPYSNKNWQMRDITEMQTRVNQMQYYAALNLLEQSSQNIQVLDSLGLNRFKNGILADDFSTFGVADTFNADFKASIDSRENSLTAPFKVNSLQLFNLSALDSVNYGELAEATQTSLGFKLNKKGRTTAITLPFTEEKLVVQQLASRGVNVNAFSMRNISGIMDLTPPFDNWISTVREPSLLFIDPTLKTYKSVSEVTTLNIGDWQAILGTKDTTITSSVQSRTTTTETTTTEDYTRNVYYGNYSETLTQKANYVKNISILPYIRAQQIQFVATNMLFNTGVNAFFDERLVTKFIRKPNLVNVTVSSGTFVPGSVVGYDSSGTFIKTGKVIDVYRVSANVVRLYVVDDNNTTSYGNPSTGAIASATFNSTGTVVTTPAIGTVSSSVHYAGHFTTDGNSTSSITLNSKASSTNDFYNGLYVNILGYSTTGMAELPSLITAYNGTTKVATLSTSISFKTGDVYSIGPIHTNEIGNVSGIFYLPFDTFLTGQRMFRLDNRILQPVNSTQVRLFKGTETTFAESPFFAQGLLQKTEEIEFSPSLDAASQVQIRTEVDSDRLLERTITSVTEPLPRTPIVIPGITTPITPVSDSDSGYVGINYDFGVLTTSDGTVVTDGSGNPVTVGQLDPAVAAAILDQIAVYTISEIENIQQSGTFGQFGFVDSYSWSDSVDAAVSANGFDNGGGGVPGAGA